MTQSVVESSSLPIAQFGNEQRSIPMTHCAVEQCSLPMPQSAVEQRSVRLTQCAVESTSVPIAQFGNEQRSIPMPQSADGQLSVPVTDCAVGPKSGKRLQRLDRFTWRCHARQAEVCGSARNRVLGVDLGRNNQRPSTAPADVGVLPVPVEARINFPVIPGDAAETQEHSP